MEVNQNPPPYGAAFQRRDKMTNHDQHVTGHTLTTCPDHGTRYYAHEGGCEDCEFEHEALIEDINKRLESLSLAQLDKLLECLVGLN